MVDSPRIFICYAHADNDSPDPSKRWLDRLLEMLGPLQLQGLAKAWSDHDIELAEDWHSTILEKNSGKTGVLSRVTHPMEHLL